jgi:uncharacterized protein YndB with AHSA1/START domain
MMKRDLLFERFLNHPPERVWRALTESELMGRWMMETDFQPVVGHRFQLRTEPGPTFDGVLYGEVVTVDPPRLLAYTFIGGIMKYETTVIWTLTPQAGGTLLKLEHTGFTGLKDVIISHIIGFGWSRMLKDLPAVLAQLAITTQT